MAVEDRDKALATALGQIEKQFGKGSVMRMGEHVDLGIEAIPTGALSLDLALGIGGLPRGRIVELFGPESSGKSTLAMHVVAEAQRNGGICAYIDAEHAMDPTYARAIGVNVDDLLISQPDTGEQALEIADMLIRSGAIDVIVIDSVAALTPRAEIEGEMGDSHVGLQARLMSQALRKLAGTLNKSNTIAVFINQLREKIGVLYGCFSYGTRVVLADGSTEKIGKIVNQRLPVEVLSYDPDARAVVPKRVVNWFDNGKTDEFLQFTVAKASGNGRAQFAATRNHLIRTPSGWREAGSLSVGDRVLQAVPHRLSTFQWEALRGTLMGDGAVSSTRSGYGARLRLGHRKAQAPYAEWKASLFGNLEPSRHLREHDGAAFYDFEPLPELAELRRRVYDDGKKVFDEEFLKHLTPLSLALWYADVANFTVRSKGLQKRSEGGTGRATICVEAMEPATRERLVAHLRDTWGITATLFTQRMTGKAILRFTNAETAKLHALIARYVHPSMEHKLLPAYRGRFEVEPHFVPVRYELMALPVLDIHVKPQARSMHRFDIEVEGSHNYLVEGVVVHNSPEITPGGRALKFYASVRLDIRRTESIKDGADVIGNRTRVKVVKNKCSAPFRQAEFDIMFGTGISREGSLLDVAVDLGLVKKSGAWFTYEGEQLGQGRENVKTFLRENPQLMAEIDDRVRQQLTPRESPETAKAGSEVDPDDLPITLEQA
jgi:recombination protein RecA